MTWGIVVLAAAAAPYGRLRSALVVISTFWAFAGVTSVHGVAVSMLRANIVSDLLLVAALLAVAIAPLGQFASDRLSRPPLGRPSPPGLSGGDRPARLAGAGAGTVMGAGS